MLKKNLQNFALVIIFLFGPCWLVSHVSDIRFSESFDKPGLIIFGIGSYLLIRLNRANRKADIAHKWWWLVFQIIGVIGLTLSVLVLAVLLMFSHCCGI